MSEQPTVLLVWEAYDLLGVYADTEAGRAAAERRRAATQEQYDALDREDGVEPRPRPWIEVRRVPLMTGEEAADE